MLADLWSHREVFACLTWRFFVVRYRQTILGAGWAVLQPVALACVFTLVLGRWVGMESNGLPYSLFVLAGLIPWSSFAGTLQQAAGSVVDNAALVRQVYFPRALLPAALIAAGFVDLLISTPVLMAVAMAHGFWPSWRLIAIVPCAALAALVALGSALWLAPLYARYRDIRFVLPFAVQMWFFATPVVYATEIVPQGWRTALAANPMVTVVEGFRWAVTGSSAMDARSIAAATVVALLIAATGWMHFARIDRKLADVV